MAFTRIGFGQVEPNQLSGIKTGQIYASLPLDPAVKVLQNGEFMFYDYVSGTVTATDSTGVAEPMMVYNEVKIYEDWLSYKDFAMIRVGDNYITNPPAVGRLTSANSNGQIFGDGAETLGVVPEVSYGEVKDEDGNVTTEATVLKGHVRYDYRMDGIVPRMLKTNPGDIMTTNMVPVDEDYAVGDLLAPAEVEVTWTQFGQEEAQKTLVLSKGGSTDGMVWAVAKVYTMPDGQPGLKLQRVK